MSAVPWARRGYDNARRDGATSSHPFFFEEGNQFPSAAPRDVHDATNSLWRGQVRTAWIHGRSAVTCRGGGPASFAASRPPVFCGRKVRVHGGRPVASTARLRKAGRSQATFLVLGNSAENPPFAIEKGVRHSAIPLREVTRRCYGRDGAVLTSRASLGRVIGGTNGRTPRHHLVRASSALAILSSTMQRVASASRISSVE